jgi:hypothetical protein
MLINSPNHDWRAKNRRTNFGSRQDLTPSTPSSIIIICWKLETGGKKATTSRYRRREDKATTTMRQTYHQSLHGKVSKGE